MEERARRVGLNEALFRTVNDQVHGLSERFAEGEPADIARSTDDIA